MLNKISKSFVLVYCTVEASVAEASYKRKPGAMTVTQSFTNRHRKINPLDRFHILGIHLTQTKAII